MPSMTSVIFRKEMKETFRDKRVILGVIVSPLLLTPVLMGFILFFASQKAIEQQTATLNVGILAEYSFPELTNHVEANEGLNVTRYETREEATEAINNLSSRAVLIISENAQTAFESNGKAPIEILYNNSNENSENAKNRLRRILRKFDQTALADRLAAEGLDQAFTTPTLVTETSLAEKEALVGFVLSMILPYLVVMGAAFGGINTAFDLCAGEKERGTMETLLVSPASRYDIVKGKLFTIFTISLVSAVCSILGILIVIIFGGQIAKAIMDQELIVSYSNLAALVVIVIPLSLLTSAGLLFISSFARNQKEAQAYIFPLVAIVLFPAALSSILGAESPLYTAFIPILNIALAMKQLLGNVFDLQFFCIALGTSFAYAFAAMKAAASLFQKESILFRA